MRTHKITTSPSHKLEIISHHIGTNSLTLYVHTPYSHCFHFLGACNVVKKRNPLQKGTKFKTHTAIRERASPYSEHRIIRIFKHWGYAGIIKSFRLNWDLILALLSSSKFSITFFAFLA